jgi:uncharacterized protein
MMEKTKAGWALVTGASSGMGADFARRLAERGYDIVVTARRRKELEDLRAEILAARPEAEVLVIDCDLGTREGRDKVLQATAGLEAEVLINNAGFGAFGAFDAVPPETDEAMIALNVSAHTALTRAFASRMKARGRGFILETASIGAFQPCPMYGVYGATKAYVLSYGLAVRKELEGTGVSLTVLCPGVTKTGFFDAAKQASLTRFQRSSMQESDFVVRGALRALFAGKAIFVPGAMNRLNAFAVRFVSRSFAAGMAGNLVTPKK